MANASWSSQWNAQSVTRAAQSDHRRPVSFRADLTAVEPIAMQGVLSSTNARCIA